MHRKTRRLLCNLTAFLAVAVAVGFVVWASVNPVLLPVATTSNSLSPNPVVVKSYPVVADLQKLADKRLQGPAPVLVETKPVVPVRKVTPPFKLVAVYYGRKSRLAVLEHQQKRHTIGVGEKLAGAELTKVNEDKIEVVYQGQTCQLVLSDSSFPRP